MPVCLCPGSPGQACPPLSHPCTVLSPWGPALAAAHSPCICFLLLKPGIKVGGLLGSRWGLTQTRWCSEPWNLAPGRLSRTPAASAAGLCVHPVSASLRSAYLGVVCLERHTALDTGEGALQHGHLRVVSLQKKRQPHPRQPPSSQAAPRSLPGSPTALPGSHSPRP